MVRLRLTSRGKRSDDLQVDIDAATVLRKALGMTYGWLLKTHRALCGHAFEEKDSRLEPQRLHGRGIAAALNVPGSSAYFEGLVAYSYE